ncbi:tyrosine-type recombinase/integrase [Mycoplasmopsis hyopharyngis]|uniref:tyrosine-type recombinase/integrase n=1 Tax=Mycoplasmopsis hyopharyngis TaxID=29558 RepID=UPI0038732020
MKNIEQLQIFYEQFEHLIKTNNRSLKTLETYKQILKRLENWETTNELLNQINFILDNSNLSQNSLFCYRAVFKVFCEWFSKRNRIFIPFSEKVNKYKIERGTRRPYSKEELDILFAELKNFNNYKFELIFKIMLTTGIRVSEWEFINWDKLKENNFEIIIKTAKNNNPRPFKIICSDNEEFSKIKIAIEKGIKLNWTAKTIKNKFNLFKNFVMKKHPDFKAKISAHILRHTFVTISSENSTIEEIAKVLGHVNSNVTASTYLKFNSQLANRKLTKMQNTLTTFVNDEIIKSDEDLKIENQALKIELKILREQLKAANENIKNSSKFGYFFKPDELEENLPLK